MRVKTNHDLYIITNKTKTDQSTNCLTPVWVYFGSLRHTNHDQVVIQVSMDVYPLPGFAGKNTSSKLLAKRSNISSNKCWMTTLERGQTIQQWWMKLIRAQRRGLVLSLQMFQVAEIARR